MAKLEVIAQNFHIYDGDGLDQYARTGEISLEHLYNAGAQGVILGHSEINDNPATVNKKLLFLHQKRKKGLSLDKNTVLIGETWDEFNSRSIEEVAEAVKSKCELIFKNARPEFLSETIIGYEPKWGSYGSGRDDMPPPQPVLISACISKIKEYFQEEYHNKTEPLFIYGGRSNPERTEEILKDENISGLILGSACRSIDETRAIAKTIARVRKGKKKILICNFKAYNLADSYENYVAELGKLDGDFTVQLAPPYTDIERVKNLI